MDFATIIGLLLGIFLIGGSMFLAGATAGLSIINFWNLALVYFSYKNFKKLELIPQTLNKNSMTSPSFTI